MFGLALIAAFALYAFLCWHLARAVSHIPSRVIAFLVLLSIPFAEIPVRTVKFHQLCASSESMAREQPIPVDGIYVHLLSESSARYYIEAGYRFVDGPGPSRQGMMRYQRDESGKVHGSAINPRERASARVDEIVERVTLGITARHTDFTIDGQRVVRVSTYYAGSPWFVRMLFASEPTRTEGDACTTPARYSGGSFPSWIPSVFPPRTPDRGSQ